MLFKRFLFVLYLLSQYGLFLLGSFYQTPLRLLPLCSIILSMISIIVITFFQLQRLAKQSIIDSPTQWSTIVWSFVHIFICLNFLIDYFELANIMVIMCIIGIFLTIMISVVGICACYVIFQKSRDWYSHVYLTCICFWILLQFMEVRVPNEDLKYITTIPVISVSCIRLMEHIETYFDKRAFIEMALWSICILFHIFLDTGYWQPETFYWCFLSIIMLIIVLNGNTKHIIILVGLPFLLIYLNIHLCYRTCQGYQPLEIWKEIIKYYELMMEPPKEMEPFEINEEDLDFGEKL